jgi:hypothetical protein
MESFSQSIASSICQNTTTNAIVTLIRTSAFCFAEMPIIMICEVLPHGFKFASKLKRALLLHSGTRLPRIILPKSRDARLPNDGQHRLSQHIDIEPNFEMHTTTDFYARLRMKERDAMALWTPGVLYCIEKAVIIMRLHFASPPPFHAL